MSKEKLAEKIAEEVWLHAQRKRFTWTLESMECIILECLKKEMK